MRHHERTAGFAVEFHACHPEAVLVIIHVLRKPHRRVCKGQNLSVAREFPDRHGQIDHFHRHSSTATTLQVEATPRTIFNGDTISLTRSLLIPPQWTSLRTVVIPERANSISTAKSFLAFSLSYRCKYIRASGDSAAGVGSIENHSGMIWLFGSPSTAVSVSSKSFSFRCSAWAKNRAALKEKCGLPRMYSFPSLSY